MMHWDEWEIDFKYLILFLILNKERLEKWKSISGIYVKLT